MPRWRQHHVTAHSQHAQTVGDQSRHLAGDTAVGLGGKPGDIGAREQHQHTCETNDEKNTIAEGCCQTTEKPDQSESANARRPPSLRGVRERANRVRPQP